MESKIMKTCKIYQMSHPLFEKCFIGSTKETSLSSRLQTFRNQYAKYKNNTKLPYHTYYDFLKRDEDNGTCQTKIILLEKFDAKDIDDVRQKLEYWKNKNKDCILEDDIKKKRTMKPKTKAKPFCTAKETIKIVLEILPEVEIVPQIENSTLK